MAWFHESHPICTDGRNVGLLLARRDSRADCLVAAGSRGARARGGRTSVRGEVLEKPPRRCPAANRSHPTGSIRPLQLVESVTVGWMLRIGASITVQFLFAIITRSVMDTLSSRQLWMSRSLRFSGDSMFDRRIAVRRPKR